MSHQDDFDRPEDQEGSEDESRLQNGIPDNEYYSFLNVPRSASQEEITGAYKKLSRLYHPDKVGDLKLKKIALTSIYHICDYTMHASWYDN